MNLMLALINVVLDKKKNEYMTSMQNVFLNFCCLMLVGIKKYPSSLIVALEKKYTKKPELISYFPHVCLYEMTHNIIFPLYLFNFHFKNTDN